jgi:regulator of RNase E activity RraA
MKTLAEQCVDLIKSNRISSTEVADALGKKGVEPSLFPINTGLHKTGILHYVYAHDESNWPVHEQIRELPQNVFLYVDTFDCKDKAIFGDLVSKYLLLYQNVEGVVVKGRMRDVPDLKKYNFPIWCEGNSPLGCFNRKVKPSPEILEAVKKRSASINGGIAVCDDSGCTIIKKENITEELYRKLEFIELQEDIWSFCINTLKWNTYDTVCLKKYMDTPEILPEILREKVQAIPFKQ